MQKKQKITLLIFLLLLGAILVLLYQNRNALLQRGQIEPPIAASSQSVQATPASTAAPMGAYLKSTMVVNPETAIEQNGITWQVKTVSSQPPSPNATIPIWSSKVVLFLKNNTEKPWTFSKEHFNLVQEFGARRLQAGCPVLSWDQGETLTLPPQGETTLTLVYQGENTEGFLLPQTDIDLTVREDMKLLLITDVPDTQSQDYSFPSIIRPENIRPSGESFVYDGVEISILAARIADDPQEYPRAADAAHGLRDPVLLELSLQLTSQTEEARIWYLNGFLLSILAGDSVALYTEARDLVGGQYPTENRSYFRYELPGQQTAQFKLIYPVESTWLTEEFTTALSLNPYGLCDGEEPFLCFTIEQ